jgi:hypothetical protein
MLEYVVIFVMCLAGPFGGSSWLVLLGIAAFGIEILWAHRAALQRLSSYELDVAAASAVS